MKLEAFFEKFELFAEVPGAVARMRELVLRMATSGRIANQDPTDQPASDLLKEIFESRDNLIQKGKAKYRVEGSIVQAGDTIDIPTSWARCMISEVCDLQTGATPSRQETSYFGGTIPWLVSGDINRQEIFECEGRITEAGKNNSNCKLIPPHSVLIALNGQGKTRATVALLRIAASLNQSLVAMIPYSREHLIPEYIFWNLRGRYYSIRDITGQDQRRGLNMKLVGQLSLPIPPLAEQKRIVAKVNELMALCDQLEAQQQEQEAHKAALSRASLARFAEAPSPTNLNFIFHNLYGISPADLRKTILNLAVQGRLVAQDPEEGSAEVILNNLYERLNRNVGTKKTRKQIVENLFEVPNSWMQTQLSTLFPEFQNGASSRGDKDGIPVVVLRLADIFRRTVSLHETRSIPIKPKDIQKYALKKGDILITRVNGSADIVGSFISIEEDLDVIYCDHFIRMRVSSSVISASFLSLLGDSMLIREQIIGLFVSTAGQKTVNQDHIRSLQIPLPPLGEQGRIVAKVDQLMALVDQLEAQVTSSRATAEKLLQALVAELSAAERKTKVVAFPQKVEKEKGPTKEFIEALVIAELVRRLAKPEFPLGNFRRQKIRYFAHRKASHDVLNQYRKLAAGPYDPWIEHGGPKKIALESGYVLPGTYGDLEGLVPGPNIGQIDRYLDIELILPALDWAIETFHFTKNDQLELLATVDYASEELRQGRRPVTVQEIKKLIAANKKWAPKLDRRLFSEENIREALGKLEAMLPFFFGLATA